MFTPISAAAPRPSLEESDDEMADIALAIDLSNPLFGDGATNDDIELFLEDRKKVQLSPLISFCDVQQ